MIVLSLESVTLTSFKSKLLFHKPKDLLYLPTYAVGIQLFLSRNTNIVGDKVFPPVSDYLNFYLSFDQPHFGPVRPTLIVIFELSVLQKSVLGKLRVELDIILD